MPHILRTIFQDSTVYFLVIFTSHFVLEMTLLLARFNIQLLPAIGNVVYLPIMIGRLMLSLKKAAGSSQAGEWSLTSVTHSSNPDNTSFAPTPDRGPALPTEENVPLTTVSPAMHVPVSGSELVAPT